MKILIDAGHGIGINKGVVQGYYEGNAMFRLAVFLREAMYDYNGFTSILTREKESDYPGVNERGRLAVKNKCDVMLSLHSNGAASSNAKGVTVFYSLKRPDSKDLAEKLGKRISNIIKTGTKVTYFRGAVTRKINKSGNDYYGVIRESVKGDACKFSFMIEHGFHTNRDECEFLNSDAGLRKIARVEAEVLAEYFGIEKRKFGFLDMIKAGAIASGKKPTVQELAKYDTDSDGKISSADAKRIMRIALMG